MLPPSEPGFIIEFNAIQKNIVNNLHSFINLIISLDIQLMECQLLSLILAHSFTIN
jgi:hypothetical protein